MVVVPSGSKKNMEPRLFPFLESFCTCCVVSGETGPCGCVTHDWNSVHVTEKLRKEIMGVYRLSGGCLTSIGCYNTFLLV